MLAEGEMERWKGSEYEFWRQPPCLLIFLKHFFFKCSSGARERKEGGRWRGKAKERDTERDIRDMME